MLKSTWPASPWPGPAGLPRRALRAYAAWARTQASTLNCGHVVTAGVAGVFVLVAVAIVYWPVVEKILVITACCALAALAAALAYGGYRLARYARGRRALAASRRPAAIACARACGRPADGAVTWANGVRSGTEYLCRQCQDTTGLEDRQFLDQLDARREREAAAWPGHARLPAHPGKSTDPALNGGTPARNEAIVRGIAANWGMAGPDGVPCARCRQRPAVREVFKAAGLAAGTEPCCQECIDASTAAVLAGAFSGPDGVPVRASQDNVPAADPALAAELARVLDPGDGWTRGHP